MEKKKMVYCRGSKGNGENVIRALEAHGGNNSLHYKGESLDMLYYIKTSGVIYCCCADSNEASLVKEFYAEIQPHGYRAEKGEKYWYINISGITAYMQLDTEENHVIDNLRYKEGNYYATKDACKKVADELNEKIKEIITNSKKT